MLFLSIVIVRVLGTETLLPTVLHKAKRTLFCSGVPTTAFAWGPIHPKKAGVVGTGIAP
ncbi:hypothetical protein [Priestia sp. YIM B13486]|uniref:hypothetical protein n=1 Tax=Priestia sp. YIM B13486 TaxID=3366304 RepID=UPI00367061E3